MKKALKRNIEPMLISPRRRICWSEFHHPCNCDMCKLCIGQGGDAQCRCCWCLDFAGDVALARLEPEPQPEPELEECEVIGVSCNGLVINLC